MVDLSVADAQWIGLRLKSILKFLGKHPHGCTLGQLGREFPPERVENLDAMLELAIAADLIHDDYINDVRVFSRTR